jgi:hypothetical protein
MGVVECAVVEDLLSDVVAVDILALLYVAGKIEHAG